MTKQAEEHAKGLGDQILLEAREELDRADQKASILLAAVGVTVGAILAGLIPARWSPHTLGWPLEAVWWVGLAFVVGGVASLILAIFPRLGVSSKPEAMFSYGDACRMETPAAVRECLIKTAEHELDRTVDQVFVVSRIVRRKYLLIRVAMGMMVVGSSLVAVAVLPAFVQ